MNNTVKLEIAPMWEEIEGVIQASTDFLRSRSVSPDVVEAFTMVITELVENGIKYGTFKGPLGRVVVFVQVSDSGVTVEVTNPFDESARPHLERLDKTIQWIRGYQDSFQAFLERLKTVAGRPLQDEESGLGLARIAYEGKAILDFFVTDGYHLNVSAVSAYKRFGMRGCK